MTGAGEREADGALRPWWDSSAALVAFMVLSALPVWVTSLPPLNDYPGHIGRYFIQLNIESSPLLQRNWEFQWALVGNLGFDLLMMPLASLFGLERGAWFAALCVPPLMVWGLFRAARAVHGVLPAATLAALPFVLAFPFQMGFVNYWLGVAAALHAFAFWVGLAERPGLRAALFIPAAGMVWLVHVFGWGILGILVFGYEFARRGLTRPRWLGEAIRAAFATWPLLLPLLLTLAWRSELGTGDTGGWFALRAKATALVWVLRDQWMPLDLATLIATVLLVYTGIRHRDYAVDHRLGLAALLFAILFLLFPMVLLGSGFADARLIPLSLMTALLAIKAGPERRETLIATVATLVFALRVAIGLAGYAGYERAYSSHLAALEPVPRGARIAVMVPFPCGNWRQARIEHLGSMAIVRKEAFVNSQWDVPGAQLLRPKGLPGDPYNADPSQFVGSSASCPPDRRHELAAKLAAAPLDRFDHVWVLGFDPRTLPAFPGLNPLYSDRASILYRIEPSSVPR